MRKEGKIARLADFVLSHVLQKRSLWKLLNVRKERNISTGKKNMQQYMRLICCVAYSVACVKKHVQRMRSILPTGYFLLLINVNLSFMEKIYWWKALNLKIVWM